MPGLKWLPTAVRKRCARWKAGSRDLFSGMARVLWDKAAPRLRLPVDVYTTADEIIVLASLPGVKSTDIDITVEENQLTICGKYAPPVVNVEYAVVERDKGFFSRALVLKVPVDAHNASATLKDGVLTLALPKVATSESRVIRIRAKA